MNTSKHLILRNCVCNKSQNPQKIKKTSLEGIETIRGLYHVMFYFNLFLCSVINHVFTFPCQEHGVSVLTEALEQCLAVKWGEGYEVLSDSTSPPISKEVSQEVIEILKTLFNIAHMCNRQEPDEVKTHTSAVQFTNPLIYLF